MYFIRICMTHNVARFRKYVQQSEWCIRDQSKITIREEKKGYKTPFSLPEKVHLVFQCQKEVVVEYHCCHICVECERA